MIDKPLLTAVVALLTLSLVMDYSLSLYAGLHFGYGSDWHFFMRQSVAVVLGIVLMVILSRLDPDRWFLKIGWAVFIVSLVLMIVMQGLPSSLVRAVGGAKRWIHIGPMAIAPVEFFKVGFIFFLAWSFSRKFRARATRTLGYIEEMRMYMPYLTVFLGAVLVIAIFQKDLGQVLVLGATLLTLFLLVGSSKRFLLTLVGLALVAVAVLIKIAPHRMARIKSWWLNVQDAVLSVIPFDWVQQFRIQSADHPYQVTNSLHAIHNGGLFGQGLGNGQFKLGYLSEVHTDFILAGIAEELGFVGLAAVTLTIFFVMFRMLVIASKVENPTYYLFGVGIASMIGYSFLLNAYGISGMTPVKGIAVPFVSYGGSHILASSLAVGMMLMISKKVPRDIYGRIL